MEFANDQLAGTHLQYNLKDTMVDLMFDGFGGVIVAAVGSYYLTHTTHEHFVSPLNFDEAKKRLQNRIAKRKKAG